MNKAVMVLTAGTIVLTATTLHYAHELGELRSREAPAARPAAVAVVAPEPTAVAGITARPATAMTPTTAASSAAASPNSAASPAPAPASARPTEPADSLARARALRSGFAREYLARYDDPAKRAEMIAAATESRLKRLRKSANALDLPDEQLDTVVRLQVDERLDRQARASRCLLDLACVTPAPAPAALQERRRVLTEEIGEKKLSQLRAQEFRGAETWMVEKLQSRLPPDLRLKPAEEEALTEAMGDELRQMAKELRREDNEVSTYGGYGVVPYVKGVASLEENMEFAHRSSRRLNDLAATLLTGRRLEIFNTLQADGVVMFREFIRREISLQAAGYKRS